MDLEVELSSSTKALISDNGIDGRVGGRKRPLNLIDCANFEPVDRQSLDEASLYNLVHMGHLASSRKKFIGDDFSVMNFWQDRKKQFRNLFAVVARL